MAERWERAAHYYKSLTLYVNKADCCKLKLYPINPKIMTKIIMNKINILANKRRWNDIITKTTPISNP